MSVEICVIMPGGLPARCCEIPCGTIGAFGATTQCSPHGSIFQSCTEKVNNDSIITVSKVILNSVSDVLVCFGPVDGQGI